MLLFWDNEVMIFNERHEIISRRVVVYFEKEKSIPSISFFYGRYNYGNECTSGISVSYQNCLIKEQE